MGTRSSFAASVVVCVGLIGCGSHAKSVAPQPSAITVAFQGSPPPLAQLHAQANQLLGGGPPAFNARLAGLRGYPVVVNKWASWCGPCRFEFPAFQRASVAYGRRVGFVGLDTRDSASEGASFLRIFPVSYPSYDDPREHILPGLGVYPQTLYFNRDGKMVYDHAGPYASARALEQDIRRYALR